MGDLKGSRQSCYLSLTSWTPGTGSQQIGKVSSKRKTGTGITQQDRLTTIRPSLHPAPNYRLTIMVAEWNWWIARGPKQRKLRKENSRRRR